MMAATSPGIMATFLQEEWRNGIVYIRNEKNIFSGTHSRLALLPCFPEHRLGLAMVWIMI